VFIVFPYARSGARPASCTVGDGGSFPEVGAAGTCAWRLTIAWCRGQECVELLPPFSQYVRAQVQLYFLAVPV